MQKRNTKHLLIVLITLLFVSLACGTNNGGNLEAAAAETVEAELTRSADISSSVAQTQAAAEANVPPTTAPATDVPVETAIPTVAVPPTSSVPCDVASFVSDVTVPDGTDFVYGENFTKTWRLKNVGTCTWTTAYDLVFYDGEQMGGVVSQPLIASGSVAPNESINISVDLVAPNTTGNFVGYWKLRNQDNVVFELGNGDPFYVEIESFAPTATPDGFVLVIPGILEILPIYPDFTIASPTDWYCFTFPNVSFRIENIGIATIESMHIRVEGPIGNVLNENMQNTPFRAAASYGYPQCIQPGLENLAPGGLMWVKTTLGSAPLPGSSGKVTIKMCTLDDLGGFCTEHTYNFIW